MFAFRVFAHFEESAELLAETVVPREFHLQTQQFTVLERVRLALRLRRDRRQRRRMFYHLLRLPCHHVFIHHAELLACVED